MSNWEFIAKKCETDYDVQVEWDERCFICPECHELIYQYDWDDQDFVKNNYYICPVCKLPLFF